MGNILGRRQFPRIHICYPRYRIPWDPAKSHGRKKTRDTVVSRGVYRGFPWEPGKNKIMYIITRYRGLWTLFGACGQEAIRDLRGRFQTGLGFQTGLCGTCIWFVSILPPDNLATEFEPCIQQYATYVKNRAISASCISLGSMGQARLLALCRFTPVPCLFRTSGQELYIP